MGIKPTFNEIHIMYFQLKSVRNEMSYKSETSNVYYKSIEYFNKNVILQLCEIVTFSIYG